LHLGESGIVFDPGFDFIENFMEAEFTFSQISKVFISHAHNDHDADLESILTLLHVYNSEVKDNVVKILIEEASDEKIPGLMKKTENEIYDFLNSEFSIRYNNRRKVIDIYLSLSAFKNTLPYWISSRPVTTAFMC